MTAAALLFTAMAPRAGERADEPLDVVVAAAAGHRSDVVLERRVAARHVRDGAHGLLGKRAAPEVRVDDDARGVHHAPKRRAQVGERSRDSALDGGTRGLGRVGAGPLAGEDAPPEAAYWPRARSRPARGAP